MPSNTDGFSWEMAMFISVVAPTSTVLSPVFLLTATAGLVAFHIGLFTLVGRERKSPYITNAIFPVFLLCLIAATLAIASALIVSFASHGVWLSGLTLLIALVLSVYSVFRVLIRFVYFVDSIHVKNWPGIRHARRWFSGAKPEPTYEHNPIPLGDEAKKAARSMVGVDAELPENLVSLAIRVKTRGELNESLIHLCAGALDEGMAVQYVTASRHPYELVSSLKTFLQEQKWRSAANRIVVIDAYSPHFAFLDSIYEKKTRELRNFGVTTITSSATYAGVHSASSKAFNVIKRKSNANERHPALVVYEDCAALADLESSEQYRIFVRHVLPSERLWGGMLTVFAERSINNGDWDLLSSYCCFSEDRTK